PPNLKFSHRLHVAQKLSCASCHDVQSVDLATRNQLPTMSLCLGCHDGQKAPAACASCHPAGAAGRIETDFPAGKLVPTGSLRGAAPAPQSRPGQGGAAQNEERYCASCNPRAFCRDGHPGGVKPLVFHGGDYVLSHAVAARRETTRCQACHRLQTFCT